MAKQIQKLIYCRLFMKNVMIDLWNEKELKKLGINKITETHYNIEDIDIFIGIGIFYKENLVSRRSLRFVHEFKSIYFQLTGNDKIRSRNNKTKICNYSG